MLVVVRPEVDWSFVYLPSQPKLSSMWLHGHALQESRTTRETAPLRSDTAVASNAPLASNDETGGDEETRSKWRR